MAEIPSITEPSELIEAYLFLTRSYGKDIYRDPIKACGFFRDITGQAKMYGYSWVEKEEKIFKRLLDDGVPGRLLDNCSKRRNVKKSCRRHMTAWMGILILRILIPHWNVYVRLWS